jgi:hypothetical protein
MELTGYPIAFVSQSKPFYKAMEADFSLWYKIIRQSHFLIIVQEIARIDKIAENLENLTLDNICL